MKKILLIIEDDFEIMGNGLGNVAYHQYIPANFLQNVCEEIGVRMTFMVDLAHIFRIKELSNDFPDLRMQEQLWEESVKQMVKRNFDVQLHLHPQWLDAPYKHPFFYLSSKWNIGQYDKSKQELLIKQSVDYLNNLLKPIKKDYKVHSFKAGSWGMQPSENLLNIFDEYGFKVVMGLRKDMYLPSGGVDYRNLEEDTLPYYPDFADIKKVGRKGDLITIPLAYYSPDLLTFGKLAFHLIKRKLIHPDNNSIFYNKTIPNEIHELDGIAQKNFRKLKISTHPYLTHLKMSNEPFSYLKKSFDTVFKRLSKIDMDEIPLIVECHTKHCIGNYDNIRRFLYYITNKYNDRIEFITLSDFVNRYQNKIKIRSNENQ